MSVTIIIVAVVAAVITGVVWAVIKMGKKSGKSEPEKSSTLFYELLKNQFAVDTATTGTCAKWIKGNAGKVGGKPAGLIMTYKKFASGKIPTPPEFDADKHLVLAVYNEQKPSDSVYCLVSYAGMDEKLKNLLMQHDERVAIEL